jgi:hypothetical protein
MRRRLVCISPSVVISWAASSLPQGGGGGQVALGDLAQVFRHLAQAAHHHPVEGQQQVAGDGQAEQAHAQFQVEGAPQAIDAGLQAVVQALGHGRAQGGLLVHRGLAELLECFGGALQGLAHQLGADGGTEGVRGGVGALHVELGRHLRIGLDALGIFVLDIVVEVLLHRLPLVDAGAPLGRHLLAGQRQMPQGQQARGVLVLPRPAHQREGDHVVGVALGVEDQAGAVGDLAHQGQQGRDIGVLPLEGLVRAAGRGLGLQRAVQAAQLLEALGGVEVRAVLALVRFELVEAALHLLLQLGQFRGLLHGRQAAGLGGAQQIQGRADVPQAVLLHPGGMDLVLGVAPEVGHQDHQRDHEGHRHPGRLAWKAQTPEQPDAGRQPPVIAEELTETGVERAGARHAGRAGTWWAEVGQECLNSRQGDLR